MTTTRHLVIGAGEVGTALAEILHADLRDIGPHRGRYDALHIAIPWTPDFVDIVDTYVAHHQARLVIVHSTVPVGTCDPQGWVHSPIRGRHPDLTAGIRMFVKHVGGPWPDSLAAAALLRDAGIPVICHDRAAVTEAGKLWELASYGLEIALEKNIHAWCQAHGLDHDEVYGSFGTSYNQGWRDLNEPRFVKPQLTHVEGPIGGHCVVQGSRLIDDAPWLRDLLEPHSAPGLWDIDDLGEAEAAS